MGDLIWHSRRVECHGRLSKTLPLKVPERQWTLRGPRGRLFCSFAKDSFLTGTLPFARVA